MRSQPVVLYKGTGYTEIFVSEGVELRLTATLADGSVRWQSYEVDADAATTTGDFTGIPQADGSTLYRETVSSAPDPSNTEASQTMLTVPVTIDQESGQILVIYSTRTDEEKPE
ncbi:hypothetical protein [Microbacterium sp. W4I4]|uniref:hypothetical protein n=1 Tax=Microbacterium sp. W4I4 TaxID=3042295 RepID=UPI0027D8B2B5|nr:hypothetical protein [Microbacterium sp. W4I4]